jgi:sugar O-acyltransferase (sialic acid O-acetyltransferase NeuD family)
VTERQVSEVNLIIIGAGDHGRGTLEIVRACNAVSPTFRVLGYLDDAPSKRDVVVDGLPVLGGLGWLDTHHRSDLQYVLALADCLGKQRIASRLEPFALRFASIVHPSVIFSSGVRVGEGATIGAGSVIAHDTRIGVHTTINLNSTIGHDCVVGRFATVAPGANIAGRVDVGEGTEVGLNASVGRGIRIGDWTVIGPGAVVLKDVAARQRVFGNPGRLVPAANLT